MIWLNTYWTWQYFLMLLFVFITLWMAYFHWWPRYGYYRKWQLYSIYAGQWVWPTLGTFFFHCWW